MRLLAAALALAVAGPAGAFDAYGPERHYYGPLRVTWIDSQATPLACGLIAAECVDVDNGSKTATIRTASDGPAAAWAFVGTFMAPDELLGHGLVHAFEGSFHPVLLPWVRLSGARQ